MSATYPDGVRVVETLSEGQVHVRLSREVDLDELLLWLATEYPGVIERDADDWWETYGDYPTRIDPEFDREVLVGRFRKQPCVCWDGGHDFDVADVPEGANQRGSYLGLIAQ